MKKLLLNLALAATLLAAAAPQGWAWGIFGHRVVTQVAVYELPAPLQAFYYHHMASLVRQSSNPAADAPTNAQHFIKLDHYSESNPFARMPRTYPEAVEKFSADTLRKYGTLPWAIMEAKEKLVQAWQQRDTAAVILASAELSNLAADACSPLRTTVDYDGQLTNQTGILTLWENQLPEHHVEVYKLDGEPGKFMRDPLVGIWAMLQSSYGFLTATFDMESKVSRGFTPKTKYAYAHRFGRTQRRYSDAFVEAYHKEVGGQVCYRLQQAAPFVASLWITAWQEAGHPGMGDLLGKVAAEEKEKLAVELKAFKVNRLGKEQLLLAQQKDPKARPADQIKAAEGEMAPAPPLEVLASTTAPASPTPGQPTVPDPARARPKAPAARSKPKIALSGWE